MVSGLFGGTEVGDGLFYVVDEQPEVFLLESRERIAVVIGNHNVDVVDLHVDGKRKPVVDIEAFRSGFGPRRERYVSSNVSVRSLRDCEAGCQNDAGNDPRQSFRCHDSLLVSIS